MLDSFFTLVTAKFTGFKMKVITTKLRNRLTELTIVPHTLYLG